MKRLIGFSLVGLVYLSQQESLVSASIEPIERLDRFTMFSGDRAPNQAAFRPGQTYQAHTPSTPLTAVTPDQLREAGERVSAAENSLASRLPSLTHGETMKRWLALSSAKVNIESRSDLNQTQTLTELMQDPVGSMEDVRTLLESNAVSSEERMALISLTNDLTNHELTLPAVERVLLAEAERKPTTESESAETPEMLQRRMDLLAESYFRHVTDSEKRVQFLTAVRNAHGGSNVASVLETRYQHLLAPVTGEASAAAQPPPEQFPETQLDPAQSLPNQVAHRGPSPQQWPPQTPEQAFQHQEEVQAGYDGGYDPPIEPSNFAGP